MINDPIADMLTRMRNALMAGDDRVLLPASKMKAAILKVLKEEGYIRSFKIVLTDGGPLLKVLFKENAIKGLQRVSRPGLRTYHSHHKMPRVISGLGMSVLSTSKGVISSRQAKRSKVGGELLLNVW